MLLLFYNNRNVEAESDGCAPRFQTTGRLHGNAQRWESNKAINNRGHSLVQDKIEVEGALTGPLLLLLLLLLSPQLSFHRHIEEENSQQSQGDEHASLRPRHLSRFTVDYSNTTPWQAESFTFSLCRRSLNRLFSSASGPVRSSAFSPQESLLSRPLQVFSFRWGGEKNAVEQGRMEERSDTRGETQNSTFTQEKKPHEK